MRHLSLVLVFLFFVVLLLVALFPKDFNVETPAAGRIALGGSGVLGLASLGGIGLIYLMAKIRGQVQVVEEKKVEEKKPSEALGICEKMLFDIRRIEGQHLGEEKTVKYVIKEILPSLLTMMKQYKEFIHGLPGDYKNAFYDVYSSLAGKHAHYNPKRMNYEFRHLKESIEGILKRYNMMEIKF